MGTAAGRTFATSAVRPAWAVVVVLALSMSPAAWAATEPAPPAPASASSGDFAPVRLRHPDERLPFERSLPAPSAGRVRISAGEVVELRWTATSLAIEEFELLLSLDDGRTFALRISPELAGGECAYRWRVPELPTATARVRLRARLDGAEVDGPVGEPFVIEAGRATLAGHGAFRESGITEPTESRPCATSSFAARGEGDEWHAGADAAPLEVPGRAVPASPPPSRLADEVGDATHGRAPNATPHPTVARRHPLRN